MAFSGGLSFIFPVAISVLLVAVSSADDSLQIGCSRKCLELNCNNMGIKYGKYCGVGHSGCPGERPCDDLDACCQVHDDCVGTNGMTNVECHKELNKCIKRVHKSGEPGFSRICSYDKVVPTMVQGMEMAILMSQWATNSNQELK